MLIGTLGNYVPVSGTIKGHNHFLQLKRKKIKKLRFRFVSSIVFQEALIYHLPKPLIYI